MRGVSSLWVGGCAVVVAVVVVVVVSVEVVVVIVVMGVMVAVVVLVVAWWWVMGVVGVHMFGMVCICFGRVLQGLEERNLLAGFPYVLAWFRKACKLILIAK